MNEPLRSRRAAREKALQALYAAEQGDHPPDEALEMALEEVWLHVDTVTFARRLIGEAYENADKYEAVIGGFLAEGWSVERLAVVDRLCLVLASVELATEPGIPPKATINEWVKLAKVFGHKDSSSFVNGVLAKVLEGSPKAKWEPSMEEGWVDEPAEEPAIEVEEVEVEPDDPELDKAIKAGAWVIKQPE